MLILEEITEKIISSFYKVYNTLGYGFLEKVYENSLIHELNLQQLNAIGQYPIDVYYNEIKAGQYFADILVNKQIII